MRNLDCYVSTPSRFSDRLRIIHESWSFMKNLIIPRRYALTTQSEKRKGEIKRRIVHSESPFRIGRKKGFTPLVSYFQVSSSNQQRELLEYSTAPEKCRETLLISRDLSHWLTIQGRRWMERNKGLRVIDDATSEFPGTQFRKAHVSFRKRP